jgi:hypothetical protein
MLSNQSQTTDRALIWPFADLPLLAAVLTIHERALVSAPGVFDDAAAQLGLVEEK